MKKHIYADIAVGIVLPFAATITLLYPLLARHGYIFYGDEQWSFYSNPTNTLSPSIYSWYGGAPTSSNNLILGLLTSLLLYLGGTPANKLLTLILAALPGITAYFAIKYTFRLWDKVTLTTTIAAAVGSIFYLVNWQNPGLITPTFSWSMSYIIMPLLVYYFFRIIKYYRLKDALIFGALTAIGAPVPMWILLFIVMVVIYGVYELAQIAIRLGRRNIMRWSTARRGVAVWATLLLSAIAFNAYWLFEAIFGFLGGVGGQYLAYATLNSEVGTAHYLSFLHLIDTLMYGQPSYNFFGYNPQNWTVLNVFILMASAIPILISRPRKEILFLFSTALVAIFLAKGFNPPWGSLYYYIIKLSPAGIIGITRDVGPWIELASVSYAFLIAIGLHTGLSKLKGKPRAVNHTSFNGIGHSRKRNLITPILIIAVVGISLAASTQQTFITLGYYTYQRFAPTQLPNYYYSLQHELYSLHIKGNVMWIPTGGVYAWKNGYVLTNWGPNLYPNSSYPFYVYPYLLETNGTHIGQLLTLTDTAYLVYQSPGEPYAFNGILDNYNESYVLQRLFEQADLKLV
ncbi:MAG: hypothetical protein QW429_06265, partial [Thermoprotei archaeon]